MGIATIAVAMNRHNPADRWIVATTKHASRIALKTGVAKTAMTGVTNVAPALTIHSTKAIAFRPNTATGNMWSMTGAATT